MENRRYRNGNHQVRGNARRPFRHARRIQNIANSATAHSSLLSDHYFIWDPTEPVATRPLAWQRGTSVAYYTHDGNKNVSEVIASNNDVAAHYEYAPFGALTVSRGASAAANLWRFSSEYAEDDTATVYYNYRHYEPVTGRWMQRDPIGEVGAINVFSFCNNGVMSASDILGGKWICNDSDLDTSLNFSFGVGFGKMSISYVNHLHNRICKGCCDDGTRGMTHTSEASNGGGAGGEWKTALGPIPIALGFSYQFSGGTVDFYDSCSGKRYRDGCNTVSVTLYGGPSAMFGGVGVSLFGSITIKSTSCLGKDEISKSITGSIDLRICYIPYVCQTKNLFPGKYDRDK